MTAYFISPQNIFFMYWRDHVILEITERKYERSECKLKSKYNFKEERILNHMLMLK